jgi:hypothetical protein
MMTSNKTQCTPTRCRGRTQGKIQRHKNNETQRKKTLTKIKNPQHKCKWKHAIGGAKMQKMQKDKWKETYLFYTKF